MHRESVRCTLPSGARALVPKAHQQVLIDLQVPVLVGKEGSPVQGGEAPAVTLVHRLGAVSDDVVQLRWAGTGSTHSAGDCLTARGCDTCVCAGSKGAK